MKKLIVIGLICALLLPGLNTFAQSETQTVSSLSQRYGFVVPEGWFATNEAQSVTRNPEGTFRMAEMQVMVPLDSLTVADSETSVSDFDRRDFDLTHPEAFADFEGAALASIFFPAGVADSVYALLGGDFDTIVEKIELPPDSPFELQTATLERDGLTGAEARVSDGKITISMIFMSDEGGNALWIVWASDAQHLTDLENILTSLSYQAFDLETLATVTALDLTIALIPQKLEVDIPTGWWVIQSPSSTLVAPAVDSGFINAIGGNLQGEAGIVLYAVPLERNLFAAEPYDESGQLNPELMGDVYTMLLQQSSPEDLAYEAWSNDEGLAGLGAEIDQTAEQGAVYYVLLLDTTAQFTLVMSVAAAETWDDYEEVVKAIFNSARLIEE